MSEERGKLVLVVDDDEGMCDLMTHLVKQEGHRVETAKDGEEGARKAEALLPDLIVLDLMLPRYGGFELLRRFQNGNLARVPIMVVTGRYTDNSTMDLVRQESNVVDIFEKPVQPPRFILALQRVLRPAAAGGG